MAETGIGPDGLPIIRGNIALVGGPSTTISRAATAPAFRLIEVFPAGVLVVNSSVISGNTALTVNGGGMFNDGAASINFSRFTGNTSTVGDGGGLRSSGANGRANVFRSTFDHNISGANGGGISNGAPSRLTLIRSLIVRNTANNGGGVFNSGTLEQRVNIIRLNNPNDCVGTGC